MLNVCLGKYLKQIDGYSAFIPDSFPPKELMEFTSEIITKVALAERLIGKLDGITHILPNEDGKFISESKLNKRDSK